MVDRKQAKSILQAEGVLSRPAQEDLEIQAKINQLENDQAEAELYAAEVKEVIRMRRRWSNVLLLLIALIISVDIFVVICIGFNWMQFDSSYLVPVFIAEGMLKIFGLALIVVGFLFNKDGQSFVRNGRAVDK